MHNQKKKNTVMSQRMSVLSSVNVPQAASEAGVAKENIWIDPGFGFHVHPTILTCLGAWTKLLDLGYPVLFGISRKRVVDYLLWKYPC